MDLVNFSYRNKTYSCNCYMDIAIDPSFIFVTLLDNVLITEFGADVSIKTDCVNILAKKDDYAELIKLRQAIFNVFKTTPEFMVGKNKRMLWNEVEGGFYKLPPAIKKTDKHQNIAELLYRISTN